ncbi:MAG: SRPBCC family protein [Flavobacteriales bacterium]
MFTKLLIEVHVATNAEKAWACYTDPQHITQWNFASPDWHCPSASNDLRVGGKYIARMEARDGSFGFDFEGIYSAVEQGSSLSYGLSDGRKVEVRFQPTAEGTRVEVEFDAENENPIELQKGGWQAILNNYAKHTDQQ